MPGLGLSARVTATLQLSNPPPLPNYPHPVQLLLWSFHPLARFRLRHIPGPTPSPFVGNALELKRLGQVEAYSRWAREYGPVFKVWLGSRPVVVVADAAAGKKINLRNPTRHPLLQPMTYSKFGRVAGKGLFVVGATDPEAHRELKSIWLKVFNSASLSGFVDEMALGADVLCAKVRRAATDAVAIDVWRALGAMTMDVVAKCAFGLDLDTQRNEGAEADERVAAAEKEKKKARSSASASSSPASSQPSSPTAAATVAAAAARAAAASSSSSDEGESSSPSADASSSSSSEERDLLARTMLSSARTIFATGSTSSIYGLLAMALPESFRPVLKLFGTLFPGKVLRELEAARSTMFETSLALTRAARARVEGGEGGGGVSAASSSSKDGARGVAKGAFPELFITASRSGSGDGGSSNSSSLQQPYDDITIASQCQTFLLAGYETTATTLAFCVHWLAAHPEAAAKLARELDDAARAEEEEGVGSAAEGLDDGEAATASTSVAGIGASRVARLPYLDAVLKEVLRLTPAAPITLRVAAQDQAVSVSLAATKGGSSGGDDGDNATTTAPTTTKSFVIPKGTWIHVDSFHISRDPAVWGPDALQFRPERWLVEKKSANSSPAAALQTWAFGDGSLACVGRRLAEWESKLTLAALFRRFEFSLEGRGGQKGEKKEQAPLELECRLTLGPKAGVRVMATAREQEEKKKGVPSSAAAPPPLAKKTSSGRLFGSTNKAVPAAA